MFSDVYVSIFNPDKGIYFDKYDGIINLKVTNTERPINIDIKPSLSDLEAFANEILEYVNKERNNEKDSND